MIFAFFQNIVMAILRANPLRIENKEVTRVYAQGRFRASQTFGVGYILLIYVLPICSKEIF